MTREERVEIALFLRNLFEEARVEYSEDVEADFLAGCYEEIE